MNHLYHTLSPLILLAAFLVSLLAFLAPTPILSDRVSLLSVSTNVPAPSTDAARRWLADDIAHSGPVHLSRMVKRAKKSNSTSPAAKAATTEPIHLVFGPLGACFSNSTTSEPVCASPSFTPIFLDLYDTLSLPAALQDALPDQFPLAPTALFASLVLLAFQFLAVVFSSLSMHFTKRFAFLGAKQPTHRKAATVAGVFSLAIGLAATIALRVQLAKVVEKLDGTSATGSLGPSFQQLFAGAALEAVASLLLIAEALTSR
ncbi:hypothetical protein JCM11641_007486 [Rhodosporidiobolus odoratus]